MAAAGTSDHLRTIAIIGAGPSGLSVLERLCSNARELADDMRIRVHLIDPYLECGGRVWNADQPDRLWMNSPAGIVTLFTDDSVRCDGPVNPGPTLHEWATAANRTLSRDEALANAIDAHSPHRWPSRSVMGEYLRWFLEHTVRDAGPRMTVVRHPASAVDVVRRRGVRGWEELVRLDDGGEPLVCDYVVFAQGNLDAMRTGEEQRLARFLTRHEAHYLGPAAATADAAGRIGAGEAVLLRGLGLTFFDYLQLLTVERGGRFHRAPDGVLAYLPSGAEPKLFACSRNGVPYRPAPWPALAIPRTCAVPRYVTPEFVSALSRGHEHSMREIRARAAADVSHAYYTELLLSHPERAAMSWRDFSDAFSAHPAGDPAQRDLVSRAVPGKQDRLDLKRIVSPLAGSRFADLRELQRWMRGYIADAANRSMHRKFSADRAALTSLIRMWRLFIRFERHGGPDGDPRLPMARRWVFAHIRCMATGAPFPRQEELIALSRAGVVTFLGNGVIVSCDEDAGVLRCHGESVPETVSVTSLVEARQPSPSVGRSSDRLRRTLWARGELSEPMNDKRAPGEGTPSAPRVALSGQLISAGGKAFRTRYSVGGSIYSLITAPGLPHAGTNAEFLRTTDKVARNLLNARKLTHRSNDCSADGRPS